MAYEKTRIEEKQGVVNTGRAIDLRERSPAAAAASTDRNLRVVNPCYRFLLRPVRAAPQRGRDWAWPACPLCMRVLWTAFTPDTLPFMLPTVGAFCTMQVCTWYRKTRLQTLQGRCVHPQERIISVRFGRFENLRSSDRVSIALWRPVKSCSSLLLLVACWRLILQPTVAQQVFIAGRQICIT